MPENFPHKPPKQIWVCSLSVIEKNQAQCDLTGLDDDASPVASFTPTYASRMNEQKAKQIAFTWNRAEAKEINRICDTFSQF